MKIFSKPTVLPFTCPISNRKFETIKGLSVYITKTLHLDHKYYFDDIIKGEKIKCHFCNNDGRFISIAKGYSNLCNSEECIRKSRQTYTIEGIMYNKSCSLNQAEQIFEKLKQNNKDKNIKRSEDGIKNDPNYLKKNSSWCIEFWLNKGYNEEDAKQILSEHQHNNGNKLAEKLKTDDIFKQEWLSNINVSLQYWINKGYDKNTAIQKLKERQQTFSLDKCIEKHGKLKGYEIWQKRQDKWMNTMNSKSDEEKIEINKKKMLNNSGYSKQSQELFWAIYEKFKDNNIIFQELSNKEVVIYNKDTQKIYKFDFVDFTNKKVIEYNGDFWHCNPKLYNENYFNNVKQKYAYELWNYDQNKIEYMKNKGYDVLVIWESDFKQDRDKTIQQCIEFMNKK